MKTIIIGILMVMFTASFVFSADTKTVADQGVLTDIFGKVEIKRADKTIPAANNAKFLKDDIIVTAAEASATLKFNDGKIITLNGNRTAKISELAVENVNKKWLKKIDLSKLKSMDEKDKKDKISPTAVAGVRAEDKMTKTKLSRDYIWIDNGLPEK